MWNSYKGEVNESYLLQILFERKVKLFRLWPTSITFPCLVRKMPLEKEIKTITSVHVAREQCSIFLAAHRAEFEKCDSTTEAYAKFVSDSRLDAVLCTPDQNEHGFPILTENAANPVNFTVFGLLGRDGVSNWDINAWGSLHKTVFPPQVLFFGIQLPLPSASAVLVDENLFEELAADIDDIDSMPKVLFVTRREDGTGGLLVESLTTLPPPELVTFKDAWEEVRIIDNMGTSSDRYHHRVQPLLQQGIADVDSKDFFRLRREKSCFYACPSLGIVTHGYDDAVVEQVVRRVIARYFRLYVNGVPCSSEQKAFFDRYIDEYYARGYEFMEFVDVA